jgi:signal peptidase I
MQIPTIPTSRWFLYVSSGLLVFLCLAVLLAGLILFVQSAQPRVGQIAGSSMEPTLQGPRLLVNCEACQAKNLFARDAWDPNRPAKCPCCGASILVEDEPMVQAGESIQYLPTPWLQRMSGSSKEQAIRRGDIVVFEREAGLLKELKRVVGLPSEEVTLRDGDLWINGIRYEKTLRETLAQAVLVADWDPNRCRKTLSEFLDSLMSPPSNELPINAHDSHAIVPAKDFGIALRSSEFPPDARTTVRLSTSDHSYTIEVHTAKDWSVVCNGLPLPKLTAGQMSEREGPRWIIAAVIDGRLLVGDELGTCHAESITALQSTVDEEGRVEDSSKPFLTLQDSDGNATFDLAILFRDLIYRGYGDANEETIPAGPGYVVLGDNISISDDSRGPTGNSERWDAGKIRGVVLPTSNPMDNLLRQRSTRTCPCDGQISSAR